MYIYIYMYTQEMSFGAEGLNSDRLKLAGGMPLFAPKLPWDISRFYFLFGKPISTAGVDVDNAEQCAALYEVCLDLCVCMYLYTEQCDAFYAFYAWWFNSRSRGPLQKVCVYALISCACGSVVISSNSMCVYTCI